MEDSQKFNSLRVRLQNAKVATINESLEEILKSPGELKSIIPIVISKIKQGLFILDEHLVTLLVKTEASELYEQVKDQLLKNPWTVLNLYKERYADKKIEEILCQKLYEIAENDGNPLRHYIVEAMRDVGSGEALPTLEAIVFDFMPSAKIRTIFSESLGTVEQFEAKSRASFLQNIETAINEIKKRGA